MEDLPDEDGDHWSSADPEERRVLNATFDSFRNYRQAAHYNITHLRRQAFYSLSSAHIDLLSAPPFSLPETFDAVDNAIDSNADICDAILPSALASFYPEQHTQPPPRSAQPSDLDKARSTIRQLYRDWSSSGAVERNAVYTPVFNALSTHLPPLPAPQRHQQKVLIPGAGLGRLLFELVLQGYSAEGNEISYHQLMVSNYILNGTTAAEQHVLYPWALNFSNHLTRRNQLEAVRVPDVHPATALLGSVSDVPCAERMGMAGGDFCVVYKGLEYQGVFDAVTTVFFIDTAPNLIRYVETVKWCLRTGGIWINVGPLLWHFESAPTPRSGQADGHRGGGGDDDGIGEPGSFELTDDEVVKLLEMIGFEIVERKERLEDTGYIQDPESMLQNIYRPSFWVARKK